MRQLHQGETYGASEASLRQTRATIQALEAEHARLQALREQLDAEIAALEAVLDAGSRERLVMKD